MTQESFRLRLAKAAATQVPELEKLAAEFRQEAAEALGWVAAEARGNGTQRDAARNVLTEAGEAAWPEFVRSLVDEEGKISGWHLMALARGLTAVESQVLTGLRRALGDRRTVPIPPGAELAEEVIPEQRICDLAYLGLRRNLAAETELAGAMAGAAFSALPEMERNKEIVKFAQTGEFSAFGGTGGAEG